MQIFRWPKTNYCSKTAKTYTHSYVSMYYIQSGLPDGVCNFKPKIRIRVIFGCSCNGRCSSSFWTFGLGILQPFVIFYGHLVYIFCGNLVYFSRFGMLCQEKSGNSAFSATRLGEHSPQQEWVFVHNIALCTMSVTLPPRIVEFILKPSF
jgi:hypothetical protein